MEPSDDVLLQSWDRQTEILTHLADLIDESTKNAKPSPYGWTITEHLAHIHETRYSWLRTVSKPDADTVGEVYENIDGKFIPISDLNEIRNQLGLSAYAVRNAVQTCLENDVAHVGPYSHPIFFLQHMLWHEGYHFGLIVLALRNAGAEPTEDWQEENVWGIWRS